MLQLGECASEELTIKEREQSIDSHLPLGWGKTMPVYRQIFSSTFNAGATTDELTCFLMTSPTSDTSPKMQ